MCGLVGQFRRGGIVAAGWIEAATDRLTHRGPDDRGTWTDPEAGIELGHRRLSIVDLSPLGHQPMASPGGRFVLAFNGEIYNHQDLRHELEQAGHRFRGSSDTEVLLAGIERWGLRRALDRANGMFALAVWDREARRLGLARDRIGEKPLFVQEGPGFVRFASELKALWVDGVRPPAVDPGALALYLRFGFVPAPSSIYEGITKVRPGCIRWFGPEPGTTTEEPYWVLPGLGHGPVTEHDTDELRALVEDSVARRMVADVPVGAFLSGGIDSSLVVALMTKRASSVRSFTIGFGDRRFDESGHARAIAQHLGTDHTELQVTGDDALGVLPSLPSMFDEPFADQSAIPTSLVAALTRQHVTVALSGDGGDELFGGYTRYRRLQLGAPLAALPPAAGRLLAGTARAVGGRHGLAARARTVERIGLGISEGGTKGLYRSLLSLWERPSDLVDAIEPVTALTGPGRWPLRRDLVRTAMGADLLTYLPDDILVKVDRTSMAVALEARVPLLDHRIIEWSRRFARPSVASESQMKAPLRALLDEHVPRELWDRPKKGFGAPVGDWLRGPLRDWAEDLLAPSALEAAGLAAAPVRQRWASHLSGQVDQSFPLWTVLSYQAWRGHWGDGGAGLR